MERDEYLIMTNNPLVLKKLGDTHRIVYKETSYEGLLERGPGQDPRRSFAFVTSPFGKCKA